MDWLVQVLRVMALHEGLNPGVLHSNVEEEEVK
jgi:hypothetical protein